MKIENSFVVPLTADQAWRTLLDVPAVAPCMPGTTLLETDGDLYSGEVAVRLGPVLMTFKGRAEIMERDAAARTAKVKAQGRDTKGRGNVAAVVDFALRDDPSGTRVDMVTNLTLTGTVAQYGRGAGMIEDLSNHLIGEFARNLEARLRRERQSQLQDTDAGATGGSDAAKPLSALILLRIALRSLLRRLFGRRSAKLG